MRIPVQPVIPCCTVQTGAVTALIGALIGALGCAAGLANAAPLQFTASLEQSTWEAQSSRSRCVLRHPIPDYGTAEFTRAPGQPLRLRLDLPKPPVTAFQVEVRAAPPPWNHAAHPVDFGKHLMDPTQRVFVVEGAEAQALFDALERGLNLEFTFGPVGVPAQALVAVSSVRFLLTAPDFQTCTVALTTTPPQRAATPKPSRPADSQPGSVLPAKAVKPVTPLSQAGKPEVAPIEDADPYIRSTPATDVPLETRPDKPDPEPAPKPEPKRDAGAGLGLVEEVMLSYAPTQDELSETARIELGSFAREYLAQRRRDVVLIAGSAEHGQLTRRRALEIKGFLVRLGMPATHVLIHVPGEKLPQRDGQPVQLPADATRMSVWRVR